MEITRQVILDLLPLYLANEVSPDTRILIEQYLETDPQLAKIAEESAALRLSEGIPVPLTQDDRLRAYRRARRSITLRVIIVAGAISIVLVILTLLMFFFSSPSSLLSSFIPKNITSPTATSACTLEELGLCCRITHSAHVNADSYTAEHERDQCNDCTLMFEHQQECILHGCVMRSALTEETSNLQPNENGETTNDRSRNGNSDNTRREKRADDHDVSAGTIERDSDTC